MLPTRRVGRVRRFIGDATLPSTDNPYASDGFGIIVGSSDLDSLQSQFTSFAGEIGNQLAASGVSPQDLLKAVNQYKWLPQAAAQVARSFSTGDQQTEFNTTVSVACMAISTALPAAAPAVALIAAGLPVLEQLLGAHPSAADCGYYVPEDGKFALSEVLAHGDHPLCFRKKVPWGPSDPQWIKFNDWATKGFTDANGNQFSPDSLYCFFWEYLNIQCDAWSVDHPDDPRSKFSPDFPKTLYPGMTKAPFQGTTTKIDPAVIAFHKLFIVAWRANAELYLNGHPASSLPNLLQACYVAWQASHQATSTYTINPELGVEDQQEWTFHVDGGSSQGGRHLDYPGYLQTRGPCVRATERDRNPLNIPDNACWSTETMVQMILAGQADDQRRPPLVINTGPVYPVVDAVTKAAQIASTAVVVSGSAAAVALAGSVAYSFATGQAWDFALQNAWKAAKAVFK